ncbi:MAG: hypothetical protein V3T65_05910, partial [Acidobacteriota bacterium]
KPQGVMHELSHSYWGGFPIDGFPELGWDDASGDRLSSGLERYHLDLLAFMAQPPDDFEVLRQRLRNLPKVSADNSEPLFHNGEADLVYNTGGNLALVPPILRKYWNRFLAPGPFPSWYEAVNWFLELSGDDRVNANKYLGFEHLAVGQFGSIAPFDGASNVISERRGVLAQEEQQRLFDLADQFDSLIGDAQNEENFQFWRGYLRDKVRLQRTHPAYLSSLDLPRAGELSSALDVLTALESRPPNEQAAELASLFPAQPFLVNFLPALSNKALLELFAVGTPLPEGATLQATASFVERLNRFGAIVKGVLDQGREDLEQGTKELRDFLDDVAYEPADDLRLFFELLRDADPGTARQIVQALDKSTIRDLMEPVPFQLRALFSPQELLAKLDITAQAESDDLIRGITLMVEKPSGNFIVDEPYLGLLYRVLADVGRDSPDRVIRILRDSPVNLEGFILAQPDAAVGSISTDIRAAMTLVRGGDRVLSPPARIIYRLINANPVWAAELLAAFSEEDESELVTESLAYFAYDKDRLERLPGLPISLEKDGEFLGALLDNQGEGWLAKGLGQAFNLFGERVAASEAPPEFLVRYQETLEAAAATLPGENTRNQLEQVISQVVLSNDKGV